MYSSAFLPIFQSEGGGDPQNPSGNQHARPKKA